MTTTNEIADKIAADNSLTKVQAKGIVEAVFKAIAEAAGSDAETSIPGFGKFKVKASPEREGRNPSTGATMKIAASKKLTFAPAKALKDALNK
jgi:DNA-binding protein HU-beta